MIARTLLVRAGWAALASSPSPALIGLWADTREVHALLDGPLLVSVPVEGGSYPALSPARPGAAAFERAIHDLWGHRAEGGDAAPWFDTAAWPVLHPMSARPQPQVGRAEPGDPPVLPDDRHLLLHGPIRPGLREPALLRAVTDGRTIEAASARLGHAHKGTMLLMRSKSPRAAARFAARIQADSTVAHGLAFARAAEDASGVAIPPAAVARRLLMLAVETVTASLAADGRQGAALDTVRRAAAVAFGHRMMMDCVVPGGVVADAGPEGVAALRAALAPLAESAGSGGTGSGSIGPGSIGTSAGTALDLLDDLPPGPLTCTLPPATGEGLGQAATPRGTIWHWVRLDGGTVANVFACDPAWLAWDRWAGAQAGRVLPPDGLQADWPALKVSGADL